MSFAVKFPFKSDRDKKEEEENCNNFRSLS